MVDMPSVPPSAPPKTAPVTLGTTAVGQQQTPPSWGNLPQGAVFKLQVAGVDAKGNIRLETNTLTLVLQTQFAIPRNAQVAIRLEQPLTPESMPSVRILTVDGQPAIQYARQQAAVQPPGAQQAAELAKPVGLLLEIAAKSQAQGGQAASVPAAGAGAVSTGQVQAARNAAAQVSLSPVQALPALLVRPLVTQKAREVLSSLPAGLLPGGSNAASAANTDMLKPGLQLQVRVLSSAPPATGFSAMPAAASQQAGALPPPATGAAEPSPSPVSGVASTPQENAPPPVARAAYAAYARQPAAAMGALPAASPPPQSSAASSGTGGGSTALPAAALTSSPVFTQGQAISQQAVTQMLATHEADGLPPGQMAAVVIGREPSGNVMAQTRLGLFTLPAAQGEALQPGTVQTWLVRNIQPVSAQEGLAANGTLAIASQFGREGSAMHELAGLLSGLQIPGAAQAMQRMVPHAGSQFSAGLLLFISLIRKGDVTNWLGKELVDQLESLGKGELLQRLGGEITALRSLFSDTSQQANWQPVFFPVMVGKQMETAQMFIKPDEQGKKGGGGGTRFVVELNLSNLGPMQMDGLVKKREQRVYFDLVIRTVHELPAEVRTGVLDIFDKAQGATGMAGSLHFRVVPEFSVNPLEELQLNMPTVAGAFFA